MRKACQILILGTLMLLGALPALAAEKAPPPPPPAEGSPGVNIEALQLIALGKSNIAQVGSNAEVEVFGDTSTKYPVEYVGLRLYLERWDGSSWVMLGSWLFEGFDTDFVEGSARQAVTRGYYYRARADHLARDGSTSEMTQSFSESIYLW